MSRIYVVFFTYYHSDHTIGLLDLLLTGWLPSSFGHRVAPLHVVGPVGAKNLLSNLSAAYSADIKGRQEEQHLPPEGVASKVDEFTNDGVVYEKDGVRVTAFESIMALSRPTATASTMMGDRCFYPEIQN